MHDGYAYEVWPCGPHRWGSSIFSGPEPIREGEVRGTPVRAAEAARIAIANLGRGPVRRGGYRNRGPAGAQAAARRGRVLA